MNFFRKSAIGRQNSFRFLLSAGICVIIRKKRSMKKILHHYQTSIGRKQIVAVTGLVLIFFLVGHLAGNLFLFAGPEAFNNYAKKLASLRPGLYVVEILLAVIFLIHIFVTYLLVLENVRSRPQPYHVRGGKAERSFAAQIMPFTGSVIMVFVAYHLWDFTFTAHDGAQSILKDGKNYGLYGLVYNAFSDPLHSTIYIIAMACIGFHLSHAIESFCQTFGWNHPKYTPRIRWFSNFFGMLIGWAYSAIPLYVLLRNLSH